MQIHNQYNQSFSDWFWSYQETFLMLTPPGCKSYTILWHSHLPYLNSTLGRIRSDALDSALRHHLKDFVFFKEMLSIVLVQFWRIGFILYVMVAEGSFFISKTIWADMSLGHFEQPLISNELYSLTSFTDSKADLSIEYIHRSFVVLSKFLKGCMPIVLCICSGGLLPSYEYSTSVCSFFLLRILCWFSPMAIKSTVLLFFFFDNSWRILNKSLLDTVSSNFHLIFTIQFLGAVLQKKKRVVYCC